MVGGAAVVGMVVDVGEEEVEDFEMEPLWLEVEVDSDVEVG